MIVEDYRNYVLKYLSYFYSKEEIDSFSEKLDEIITEKLNNLPDYDIVIKNNYKNGQKKISILEVFDKFLPNTKYTISGSCTLYYKNKEALSDKILTYFKQSRKKNKDEMFQAMEEAKKYDKNSPEYQNFINVASVKNAEQLKDKLYMNSYYGILAESNSIFYNRFNAESVTTTGRTLTTTATIAFETFFGNILFDNFTQLIKYIDETLQQIPTEESYVDMKIADITPEKVIKRFIDNTLKLTEREVVKLTDFLSNLDEKSLYKLYYKNNFYEYIELPTIKQMFQNILFQYNYSGDINENIKRIQKNKGEENDIKLYELWTNYIESMVANYQFYFNRYNRCLYHKRCFVLTIDTDSTFIYLDPYVKYVSNIINKEIKGEDKISILNTAAFFITFYITKTLEKLLNKLHVEPERQNLISMKNEFIIDRIILTPKKKNYTLSILAQEGRLKKELSIEEKGLTFKKSIVHKNIKNFFQNLIREEFFKEKIDLIVILRKLKEFENRIIEELNNGSIEYAKTERVNPESGYKFPYRISAFRGAVIWNYLYPEQPIIFGDKCLTYKTNLITEEDLEKLKAIDEEKAEQIKNFVFTHEELKKYGLSTISFPFSLNKVPEWLIPFINYEEILNDSLKHIHNLLESLGLEIVKVRGTRYYTNIVDTKMWI